MNAGARVKCQHCRRTFRRSLARRKYCREQCRLLAWRARVGVHASDSPEVSAIRRANGLKVAAMRRARAIRIRCSRCRRRFTTPATRHNAKYCDPCREIQTREDRRRWKRENLERHLANRRRQQRTPRGRAAARRRAAARYQRLLEAGKITRKRQAEKICSCGAIYIGLARQCSACRRDRELAYLRARYYRDLDRSRTKARESSARSWGALSPEERSDRAWRKWIRRRFGTPTSTMLELLEALRIIRKDLERAGLYPRAEASRRNGRRGGGPRRSVDPRRRATADGNRTARA